MVTVRAGGCKVEHGEIDANRGKVSGQYAASRSMEGRLWKGSLLSSSKVVAVASADSRINLDSLSNTAHDGSHTPRQSVRIPTTPTLRERTAGPKISRYCRRWRDIDGQSARSCLLRR